jgi:DNA-binding PadR family transcriptional regulator
MSLAHALLGVLDARPMNGYALARFFAGAQNWVWSAPQSQVYAALSKLADAGWIVGAEQRSSNGPTTTVWSLTPEGRAAFLDWVATPPPPVSVRDRVALQSLFFDSVPAREAIAVLESHAAELRGQLLEWSAHRDALAAKDTPLLRERLLRRDPSEHERIARLKAHVFDGQVEQARARLAWVEGMMALLRDDDRTRET